MDLRLKTAMGAAEITRKRNGRVRFAPEERDVYSSERTPKDLAPLGAKRGSVTIDEAEAIALLRSLGTKNDRQAMNISPRRGEATTKVSVACPN
jgi:hypothetical protein